MRTATTLAVFTTLLAACVQESLETGGAKLLSVDDTGVYGDGVVWEVYGEPTEYGGELRVIAVDDWGDVQAEAVLVNDGTATRFIANLGYNEWSTAWGPDGQTLFESSPIPVPVSDLLDSVQTSLVASGVADDECPSCWAGTVDDPPGIGQVLLTCLGAIGNVVTTTRFDCSATLSRYWNAPPPRLARFVTYASTLESVHPVTELVRYTVECPPDRGEQATQIILSFGTIELGDTYNWLKVFEKSSGKLVFFQEVSGVYGTVRVIESAAEIVVRPSPSNLRQGSTWGFALRQFECFYPGADTR